MRQSGDHWHGVPTEQCVAQVQALARAIWAAHGSWCDPSDYEHEAFMGLVKALDTYEQRDGGSFQGYLAQCVRYTLLEYRRRQRGTTTPSRGNRHGRHLTTAWARHEVSPEEDVWAVCADGWAWQRQVEARLTLQWGLRGMASRLVQAQARAMIAMMGEGWTAEEYGRQSGHTAGTVLIYASRGRKALRHYLRGGRKALRRCLRG